MATVKTSGSPTEERSAGHRYNRHLLSPENAISRRPSSATSSSKMSVARRLTAVAGGGSTLPVGGRRISCTPESRQRRSQSIFDNSTQQNAARLNRGGSNRNNIKFNFTSQQGSGYESSTSLHVDKDKCQRKLTSWIQVVTALIKMQRKSRLSLFEGTLYRQQLEHIDRTSSQLPKDDKSRVMLFNPNEYKANRQMRMSEKAKSILRKAPEERTDEDIYYATIALRGISLIAEYPVRMQRKLAQFGIFQSFESRRVIVRQGHAPFAFYFILYGTVIVAVAVDDVQDAHTVCFLKRGESFGELAIMNNTPRQSTVISQDDIELLAIDVRTYEQIFMVGGAKNINDPDHNAFMASLPFLKGWPIAQLENQENKKSIVFAYFINHLLPHATMRRGAVMVRDSNYNNWIYVVKSGSVQVLKKLVKQEPTVNLKTGKVIKYTTDADIFWAFKSDRLGLDRLMQNCGMDFAEPVMDKIKHSQVNGDDKTSGVCDDSVTLLTDCSFGLQSDKFKRAQSAIIRTRGTGKHLSTYKQIRSDTAVEFRGTPNSRRDHTLSLQKNTSRTPGRKQHVDDSERDKQTKRTFLDDLDSGFKERAHIKTEADENPMFVHVQTLTKGDAFGITTLVFSDQPGLCLVSNGAECVLINKKFYEEHCPNKVMRRLKTELSPYPSETSLQGDLLTTVNWDAYKKATLNQLIMLKESKKNNCFNKVVTA